MLNNLEDFECIFTCALPLWIHRLFKIWVEMRNGKVCGGREGCLAGGKSGNGIGFLGCRERERERVLPLETTVRKAVGPAGPLFPPIFDCYRTLYFFLSYHSICQTVIPFITLTKLTYNLLRWWTKSSHVACFWCWYMPHKQNHKWRAFSK